MEKEAKKSGVDPAKKAEIMLYSSIYAVSEALRVDEDMQEFTRDWDLVAQWNLPPDGPSAYVTFKDGDMEMSKGRHESPDVVFGFNNLEDALAAFSGKLSTGQMMEKVIVKGDLEEAGNIAMVFMLASKYLP